MSYNIFETLKNTLSSAFRGEKKFLKSNETYKDIEENSSLINYDRRNYNLPTNKCNIENGSFNIRLLPSLYLAINFSLMVIMFIFKYSNKMIFSDDFINSNGLVFPDFYELYKVNNVVFHSYELVLSILGLLICFLIFSLLFNNLVLMKRDSFQFTYKLYLMLFSGIISNIFLLVISFTPRINDLNINKEFHIETKIKFNQFLFLLHIFFSILFYSFSLCSLKMTVDSNQESRKKWVCFKLIILIYLVVLLFFYIMILLYKNTLVRLNVNLEVNYSYSLIILPYLISMLNSMYMFTFYYETKEAKIYFGNLIENGENNEKNTF